MKTLRIWILLILALLLAGCKGKSVEDIRITSVRLISITPEGFSGVTALVEVGIHNPTVGFVVTDLRGLAKFQGQDALSVRADQLMVSGHSDALYRIPLQGSIEDGFNPLRLLRLVAQDASYEDVTFDVRARVALRGGLGKNIEILDIPLSELLGKSLKEDHETTTE
jgi:hypothetical protein